MPGHTHFSDTFIKEVASSTALAALVGESVELKSLGSDFIGLCPFHQEKTPSFRVYPNGQYYRCYGCGAYGDAIQWMRSKHCMSFHEAVQHMAARAGIRMPERSLTRGEAAVQRARVELRAVLETSQSQYKANLSQSEDIRQYLAVERGLNDETIHKFGLGYALSSGLVESLACTFSPQAMLNSGIARRSSGPQIVDHFRRRVMIPIRTTDGTLVSFAGRQCGDAATLPPKYLNGPQTELFQKGALLFGMDLAKFNIRRTGVAIVVEGYFDVMSLHQAGETRAVATMGTALTPRHLALLSSIAETLIFAFDGDAAGRSAARRAAAAVLPVLTDGKSVKFVFLPEGDDPDSFVRTKGFDEWEARVAAAQPLSAFLAHDLAADLDTAEPESQVRTAARANSILASIERARLYRRALQAHFEKTIGISLEM